MTGRLRGPALAFSVGLALVLAGCSSSDSCEDAATFRLALSCAPGVAVDGDFYEQLNSDIPAPRGRRLGPAVYPACDDGGDGCADSDVPTEVWKLRGVDSDDVVVGREQGGRKLVAFVRSGVEPEQFFRFTKNKEWVVRTR